MSHHAYEQIPSLNSLQVVVQSPAESAPTTAGIIKKSSPETVKSAASTETGPRSIVNQVDLTEPVRGTRLPVPAQIIVQSAPGDSVRNIENGYHANVCLITYMSNSQV
jgi:hypothetical protein